MASPEDKQEQQEDKQEHEQERADFGRTLRHFRGGVSLRDLEKSKHNQGRDRISRSTLSRYERGITLPGLSQAKHLDTLYGADGWVKLFLANLWDQTWNPHYDDNLKPKRNYFYRWPPEYSGLVWVHLKPAADLVNSHHKIRLQWGPWKMGTETKIPADGAYLVTGKAADDSNRSVTLELNCDLHVFALFGAGRIKNETAPKLDIRQKWTWR